MTKKIGFIGVGNMGGAIIRGLVKLEGVEVHGTDLNTEALQTLHDECGMIVQPDAADLVQACDYVVLAIKPQHAQGVVANIAPHLSEDTCLVSIAAGVNRTTLCEWSGDGCPVIRIMPNTPALVSKGVYAVCLDDQRLNDEQKTFIPEAFASIGQVHVLAESMFDAFTAVVGAGPAYVMYFMEALVESAVYLGLARGQATEMVQALFEGSVKMAMDTGEHMSVLREMVTSPGGSTIRALAHFDRMAVRGTLLDAVVEGYERNRELGDQ